MGPMVRFAWNLFDALSILLGFLAAVVFSSAFTRKAIPRLRRRGPDYAAPGPAAELALLDLGDAAFWIAFFETVLVFGFVHANDLTPVGLLIAARLLVTRDRAAAEPSVLLAALANYAFALFFAMLVRA